MQTTTAMSITTAFYRRKECQEHHAHVVMEKIDKNFAVAWCRDCGKYMIIKINMEDTNGE